ncbi:cell wall-binding repeat-containing protein [Agromyces silvae]|uniref:cell wall-binding repeat-containing protein n=1 Tax=Agromyces silvae TaxID=3388266 RepID=UPI00280B42D1|nr:cell wall-binding repeat-containing protein [Agromyces protaetiae]
MTPPTRRPGILLRTSAVLAGAAIAVSLVATATPAAALEGAPTVVSITFDDSNADQMAAADILNASNLDATFYTLSGFIGQPGYQTRADLDALAAAGHEIGSHTVTHPDMATLNASEAKAQACQSRETLTAWGFQVTSFAYPFASMSPTAKQAIADCGYNTARNLGDIETRFGCTGCGFAESLPTPADPLELRVPDMVTNAWTLADLQNTVINAENSTGGWVGLTFHHVCDNCNVEGLDVSTSLFTQFTQWLAARSATHNTTVKTVQQAFGGAVKPIVDTGYPPAPGPGVNGIKNPSLETLGTNGLPDCFILAGFGSNTPAFSTVSPGRTGNVAEKLVMSNYVDGDAKAIMTMDFGTCAPTVTAGQQYSLRTWYTSTAITQFAVYLRNAVGGWEYWTSSPYFPATSTYAQAIWDSPAIPAGYTGISFGLNLIGNGELVTDDYELYDLNGAPTPTVPGTPTITGTAQVGQVLTANPGTWTPAPASFSYQWLRNGVAIAGATGSTYTPVAADVGATLTVQVSGTPAGGTPASATSVGVVVTAGTITPAVPVISGNPRVGFVLTAIPGTWTPPGVVLTYQWLRNGTAITGATAEAYTLVNADLAARISVRVTGTLGGSSANATSAQTQDVQPRSVTVTRLQGADRFLTAVDVSSKSYSPGVARVYITNGFNFPDALSAAPAAARFDSPMLLTAPTSLPAAVRAEIVRLNPGRIVIVGGTGNVSAAVATQLAQIATVQRIAGVDRYETSRLIAADAFGASGATTAYVATGTNFPDALAAAPAAAKANGPTILVPGSLTTLDQATRTLLDTLNVATVKITGSTPSVTAQIETALGTVPGVTSVQRLAGPDRYATAAAINKDAFATVPTTYLASGENFPDALVGSALAGWKNAPIYLSPNACLGTAASAGLNLHESSNLTLFGSAATLSANVANLQVCN